MPARRRLITMKNLPALPAVIDVEASGFGRGSYPIEVGFVLPDGQTGCTLIRPETGWDRWDEDSAAVHGIQRNDLISAGKPASEVAQWLNRHLRGQEVYSDAWGNDLSWLGRLFEELEIPQLFQLKAIASLMTESQMKRWQHCREAVSRELNLQRHRASTDALIIQQTYARVMEVQGAPPRASGQS